MKIGDSDGDASKLDDPINCPNQLKCLPTTPLRGCPRIAI